MKFDLDVIKTILKHREPFLFIDSIEDISDNTIEASLKISENETFFNGHFPGDPVIPGVLLIEAMAQTAAFLIAFNLIKKEGVKLGSIEHDFLLVRVNSVKFKAKIVPPTVLRIKAKINPSLMENFYEASGQIYVDDEPKAIGNLLVHIRTKK